MKWKKILFIFLTVLVLALVVTVFFLSSILKYEIEKNSEAYTGRKITIENLHVNLFSGNLRLEGLKIFEPKSKAIFFACDKMDANISVHKLLGSKYDIESLVLEKPFISIIQKGKKYNYSDLIKRFSTDKPSSPKNNKPVQYWIRHLQIDSAKLVYVNSLPYNKIEIVGWDTNIPLIAWDNPIYNIKTALAVASGGKLGADINVNTNSFVYKTTFNIEQFNLIALFPYLKDYLRVKSLDGLLSANISVTGNIHRPEEVAASGLINMEKFAIVDDISEKLTSFEKMDIEMDSINTKNNFYNFKSIIISRPLVKLAMYDDGYNFQRIMMKPGSKTLDTAVSTYANIFIMMADYVQDIIKDYVANNYTANKVKIEDGHLIFTDYTHGDKFQYDLDSLFVFSDKVSSDKNRISLDVHATLNRSGSLKGILAVSPKNFQDMDIDCKVTGLLISDFNPYSKYYVATPFLNGVVSYSNKTSILNRKLVSNNILDVVSIEAGKKVKNKTAMNIPVRLAVALLKDVHGNIHLQVPVKGSLDDPKFKWGKVVWQVIKNIMEKAATAPFRFFANSFGGKPEDYKQVNFDYLQVDLNESQKKTLDNLARVLIEKPDLKLQLLQATSKEDEAEALAIREAKQEYLKIASDSLTNLAQARIDSVSAKDSLFNSFINNKLQSGSSFLSLQEKCIQLIGSAKIDSMVSKLMEQRNQSVYDYLTQQKHITADRLQISTAADQLSRGQLPKFVVNISAGQ
ncbi:MAG: DUF748 domain-containing protein [Bacteroidetes bacterium]|nr:DUF748 domain-containing protein [Bacteroidota bacterium]